MDQAKILISLGTAALSLVFSSQPHPVPFWERNIVIAADDTSPKGNVLADEDSSSVKSSRKRQSAEQPGDETPAIPSTMVR